MKKIRKMRKDGGQLVNQKVQKISKEEMDKKRGDSQ